jgi:hypothetical protein
MAVRKLTLTIVASLVTMWGGTGNGQHLHEHGLPFVDPLQFDRQITAFDPVYPMDFLDIKPEKRANVGFYGTYDRLMLSMTRPDANGPTESSSAWDDRGYGHRYDFGYMTPKNRGWNFCFWDFDGPNSVCETFRARVDLNNAQAPIAFTNTIVSPPGFEAFTEIDALPSELNDFQYGYRLYRESDSLNVADIDGYELNRTFRLKPYSNGGILEPLVGLRFMSFRDINFDSTYFGPTPAQPNGPVAPITGTVTELIQEVSHITNNQCFGGQLGFRYYRFDGRWSFSTDFKVLAMENFWRQAARNTSVVTEYGGIGTTPLAYEYVASDTKAFYDDNETVVGFDLRVESSYTLTKALALRMGVQVLDLETGLTRGNALVLNNQKQDVQLFGFSLGLTLNR